MVSAGRGMKSSLEIGLDLCCPTEKGCILVGRLARTLLPHRAAQVGNKLWRLMFRKSKPVSLAKVALQKRSPSAKRGIRELSDGEYRMVFQRNRFATYDNLISFLWIRILRVAILKSTVTKSIHSLGTAQVGSSCEFYDVVSICRSLGVVDPFLRQSDGAAKRLLRSSERPLRLYARIKSLRFTRPRRRRS